MTQSAAHIRAVAKYNAKTYDQLKISVPKGWKDRVKAAADEVGESMTKYIVNATEARLAELDEYKKRKREQEEMETLIREVQEVFVPKIRDEIAKHNRMSRP